MSTGRARVTADEASLTSGQASGRPPDSGPCAVLNGADLLRTAQDAISRFSDLVEDVDNFPWPALLRQLDLYRLECMLDDLDSLIMRAEHR